MKRTTAKGAPETLSAMEKHWKAHWQSLDQWRIQRWIERIPRHIQEVIRLEGGNEYREGAAERTNHWVAPTEVEDANTTNSEDLESDSDSSHTEPEPENRPVFGDFRDEMTWPELRDLELCETEEATWGDNSSDSGTDQDAEGSTDDES